MMFISFIIVSCVLIYCVCVCLFLFSCVSLIVYKFSPPLPRLFFLYFQLVPLLQMIVIISISYVVCLCVLIFSLSFVSSLFALSRDVRQGTKIDFISRGLRGVGWLSCFSAMKESMIFYIVLLSKQYRRDTSY